MTNPRQILELHGIFPKKKLGQNFLHDPNALQKIIDVADVRPDDTILEVGPGTGNLTKLLAENARRVIAVEVDDRLVPVLREQLAQNHNVELHWMDFLDVDLPALVGDEPYKVVANLPYYITSAILRKILDSERKPQSMTIMVQKQVAERLIATPNDMSLLTVSVQFYGSPKIMTTLKPPVFYPRPDVESSVVHMEIYGEPLVDIPDEATFFDVVRAGFGQKRKQLKNSIASGLRISNDETVHLLESAGIDPKRRAETLTLEEWADITRVYKLIHART
ncbi:MAG TPA: 16S rRNA (adenine(1518)-N(6)/adenine(1519)-N(6))-dimethyltransferase RsmA [Aggregatilineales bacterium]|nr:16S rRNA (adenine(1518)-N(6)/adenine(1519)-N(6))-dimethyltransferase RsmA [Aggregatilineales bacterium]